jgi:hypothetical protein
MQRRVNCFHVIAGGPQKPPKISDQLPREPNGADKCLAKLLPKLPTGTFRTFPFKKAINLLGSNLARVPKHQFIIRTFF